MILAVLHKIDNLFVSVALRSSTTTAVAAAIVYFRRSKKWSVVVDWISLVFAIPQCTTAAAVLVVGCTKWVSGARQNIATEFDKLISVAMHFETMRPSFVELEFVAGTR